MFYVSSANCVYREKERGGRERDTVSGKSILFAVPVNIYRYRLTAESKRGEKLIFILYLLKS